jgi:ABC-type antimicrobial peptide transport system permease subunit
MVSATLIYLDSNRQSYYLTIFDDPNFSDTLEYDMWVSNSYEQNVSIETITNLRNEIESKHKEYNIDQLLYSTVEMVFYCSKRVFLPHLPEGEDNKFSFYGINMTEDLLESCNPGSNLPIADDEIILYFPENATIDINQTANYSFSYQQDNIEKFHNITLKATGIITKSSVKENSSFFSEIRDYRPSILLSYEKLLKLLNSLNQLQLRKFELNIELNYRLNIENFNTNEIIQIASSLVHFGDHYGHHYGYDFYGYFDISSRLRCYSKVSGKINTFNNIISLFIFLAIPAFIISFLLVNFSMGIINEDRKKILALYKMRGFSNRFIFIALLIENLILGLTASFLGLLAGVPIYYLISTTTGFLSFDFNYWPNIIVLKPSSINILILFGIILTFLVNLRSILKLAKAKIVSLEEKESPKQKRKPGMVRQNIDVFLLSQGIIGILMLYFVINGILNSGYQNQGIFMLFLPLIAILAFLSPISLIIGFIFALNRFIPIILHRVGRIFWKKNYRLLGIAIRNLSVKPEVTTRTTLLIATTMAFLIMLAVVPTSLVNHNNNNTFYDAGSEIKIYCGNIDERNRSNLIENLDNITGMEASLVQKISTQREINDQLNLKYEIMGIENDFTDVAFWRNFYDGASLEKLVESIFNSQEKNPAIIDAVTAKIEELNIGDIYKYHPSDPQSVEFTIVEITDYWPALVKRYDENQRFIVTKRTITNNISSDSSNYIWCKINKNFDRKSITNEIKGSAEQYGLYIDDVTKRLQVNPLNLEGNFFWIVANFDFIVILMVLLIMLFLFTLTRMKSHSTEIGLSRALGMKYKPVFIILFFEPVILILLSGIPGSLLSFLLIIFMASFSSPIMGYNPPFMISAHFPSIVLIYLSIFVITLISGLLTSYRAARANISKILKVE